MKPWQLTKRISTISNTLTATTPPETSIDYNCLSEPEQQLFDKVQETMDKYAPAMPPKDVIEKNSDLWFKGLEVLGRRATELFVEVVPQSFCCDELETWYFRLYFYNFWLDWTEQIQTLRKMPKEQKSTLLVERREMGMLDRVFRFPKSKEAT
jgi:hypothetical protein